VGGLKPRSLAEVYAYGHSKYIIVIIEQIEGNKYCKYKTAHKA